MATRKTVRQTAVPAVQERTRQDASSRLFWISFVFLLVGAAVIVSGYAIMLLANQQDALLRQVESLSGRKVQVTEKIQPAEQEAWQFKETGVGGLMLAYRACPATFTGSCDDAMLYRLAKDGSKEVVVPSLRALSGAPLTNDLLQPLSQSEDGKWVVLGAWAFGSERNAKDRRIWVYRTDTGKVVSASANVPADAVFSPDYMYAAYAVADAGDIRDVMIVALGEDKTVSGAKADDGRTFMGLEGKAVLEWKDAKTLAVSIFAKPSGTGASSVTTKTGEKIIKVK